MVEFWVVAFLCLCDLFFFVESNYLFILNVTVVAIIYFCTFPLLQIHHIFPSRSFQSIKNRKYSILFFILFIIQQTASCPLRLNFIYLLQILFYDLNKVITFLDYWVLKFPFIFRVGGIDKDNELLRVVFLDYLVDVGLKGGELVVLFYEHDKEVVFLLLCGILYWRWLLFDLALLYCLVLLLLCIFTNFYKIYFMVPMLIMQHDRCFIILILDMNLIMLIL
jgi:hypothetical protein